MEQMAKLAGNYKYLAVVFLSLKNPCHEKNYPFA